MKPQDTVECRQTAAAPGALVANLAGTHQQSLVVAFPEHGFRKTSIGWMKKSLRQQCQV